MGRLFLIAILACAAWFVTNHVDISIGSGVGTTVQGRRVIREAGQLEASFSKYGSLDETYMLFGGNTDEHPNSLTHAIVAGLPMRHARAISASYPDFHRCASPGAAQAKSFVENLSVVAANRASRNTLDEAVRLFHERVRAGGERTCIRVSGAPLSLDSVRVKEADEEITQQVAQAYDRMNLVLAEEVELEDCLTLLR